MIRSQSPRQQKGVFFSEKTDDNQEPSHEDIEEQARRLGVDIEKEPRLLELVKESLLSQVPPPWKPCFDATKKAWYYYNQDTYKSQWEHPADPIYREKIKKYREELAMNLMQNIDTRMSKPLKSLPPLKKGGKGMGLSPMPQLKELKKLGPIPKSMTPPGESSALSAGLRSLSLNPSAFKPLGPTKDNLKPEDEMPPRTFFSSTPRDDPVQNSQNSNVITSAPKPSGLRLLGAGSSFMKQNLSNPESGEDSDQSTDDVKTPLVENRQSSKENTLAGKPFKSILVKSSIPSNLRSQNQMQSTNKKWNVDLNSLQGDEQLVWNQIHTNDQPRASVKFKLDEDTELHFETSLNENMENPSEDSKETTEQESEGEDEDSETDVSQSHVSIKREGSPTSKNSLASNLSNASKQIISSKSSSISAVPMPMQSKINPNPSEKPLDKKEQPSSTDKPDTTNDSKIVRPAVQRNTEESQGKTLEETIINLNREREQAVRNAQETLEKQKAEDISKAKEEIENILKMEMEKIKADFQIKIQTKRAELLQQHNRELHESMEMIKKQQEQQILQLKASHAAAMEKMRAEAEAEFELEKTSIREDIRKSFEKEKELLKRKLVQENEFELNKLKFELEQKKCSLEVELQNSIENLQKDIQLKLESAKSEETVPLKKEEISLALEDKEKELKELRYKYQRLENKYNILRKQIQFLVENEKLRSKSADAILKSQSEKLRDLKIRPFTDGELRIIGSENEDSANESDQDIASSSASIENPKSSDEDKEQEEPQVENHPPSRDARLYSALKSLEDIKMQIIELTHEGKPVKTQSSVPIDSQQQNSKNRLRSRQSEDLRLNSAKSLQRQEYEVHMDRPPIEGSKSVPLPNKDLVEEAKDFIRSQRHRLTTKETPMFATPIATTFGVKQRLALEMSKVQKTEVHEPNLKLKNIPPFFHSDHRDISETESSGVGSWKDAQSAQKKKVSQEIDQICQSLSALDGQMKEIWSMVRSGAGNNHGGSFPISTFNKTLTEEFVNNKYKQNIINPITAGSTPFSYTERQSLPGTIDQLKQMWTSSLRDTSNQGDTLGVNNARAFDNHIAGFLNPGSSNTFNFADTGLLSTTSINPSVLQIQPLAFDSTFNGLIPGRANTSLLVETLDEEIKQFREKQERLVNEFAPQKETTDNLHERTKHLREWLDKF